MDTLDEMLTYQLEDERFHDILYAEDSFIEGTAAMAQSTLQATVWAMIVVVFIRLYGLTWNLTSNSNKGE